MLKILFFGIQSKNHLWEYDFIHNEILPENVEKVDYFLSLDDIRNTQQKFDVLVYFCRDPQNYPWGYIPTYNDVLECAIKTNPKIIISLSDEFVYENLQDHNNLGNYCELFLKHYNHKNYSYTRNTIHIPLGYKNGFSINNKVIKNVKERNYNWSFIGTYKSDRQELVDNFSQIENNKFILRDESSTDHIPNEELMEYFFDSIFIPCSRGWSTIDTMRLYEASISGAIPVLVSSEEEIESAFKYEENPPWIFADSWENAVKICSSLLSNKEELQRMQDKILIWWQNRIVKVKNLVESCLIKNKLKNFPKIYCVGLEENLDRRISLLKQFSEYKIYEINFILSKQYPGNGHIMESDYVSDNIIDLRGMDCTVSHLKMLDKWIKESDDEYAFFCEDDLSLETVQYWNFTWEEFFNNLPGDWECVQLFIISDHFKVECLELMPRLWNFWGATAYIMKRDYAKKLIEAYHKENKYILNPVNEIPNVCYWDEYFNADPLYHKRPFVENIIFAGIGKTYNCPLFVENISIESTFVPGQKFGHIESHESILNSWKSHKENKLTLQFMSN